jgi:hypothetical protein
MPMMCEILSMSDHFLMIILMYYLAGLSLYLFCRKANPSNTITRDITLRVGNLFFLNIELTLFQLYGLNSGIIPVRERRWVSPLLLLLPVLLATLLSLPVPLLHKTRPVSVVPEVILCNVPGSIQFDIFQSSVNILGFTSLPLSSSSSSSVSLSGAVLAALLINVSHRSARRRWSCHF